MTSSGVAKIVNRCLRTITGKKLETDEQYMAYRARWAEIVKLVENEKIDAASIIAEYEKCGDSLNKRLLIQCIVRRAFTKAIPLLSQDLEDQDKRIRRDVYRALQTMFIEPMPPFDPTATRNAREMQVTAVREWLGAKTAPKTD